MTPDLRLNVGGTSYGGWKEIRVHRGLEEIAGAFEIGVSELWPEQSTPREIRENDRCAVVIDGQTVVTGYVDAVSVEYDNENHGVTVRGRDATGDLVDCSAVHAGGEWRNVTLQQLATSLAKPFGVGVRVETDLGAPFKQWAIEEGESVFENLDRAAKHRGVLLLSDGQGNLVLARPSKNRTGIVLQRGVNILRARAEHKCEQRFSEYIVKGQRAGDDEDNGEAVTSQKASARDPGVPRYRPLVLVAEEQGDGVTFGKRAAFEASVRAARGRTAQVTVQGWKSAGGKLWEPNTLVTLRCPWLRLDRELLISEVDLVLDASGTRAELGLTIPEAYSLLPVPEKPAKELL